MLRYPHWYPKTFSLLTYPTPNYSHTSVINPRRTIQLNSKTITSNPSRPSKSHSPDLLLLKIPIRLATSGSSRPLLNPEPSSLPRNFRRSGIPYLQPVSAIRVPIGRPDANYLFIGPGMRCDKPRARGFIRLPRPNVFLNATPGPHINICLDECGFINLAANARPAIAEERLAQGLRWVRERWRLVCVSFQRSEIEVGAILHWRG